MRVEHRYDVPPRVLFDVLTDEAFLVERAARFGGRGTPTVDRSPGRVVVTIPRRLPVDAVPAAFRRLVGSGDLVQSDVWSEIADDRIAGSWTTDVGGAPLDLAGRHEITRAGTGSRYIVTADVNVRVPFIGGQAERLVTQRLTELIRHEQQFAADWLALGM